VEIGVMIYLAATSRSSDTWLPQDGLRISRGVAQGQSAQPRSRGSGSFPGGLGGAPPWIDGRTSPRSRLTTTNV